MPSATMIEGTLLVREAVRLFPATEAVFGRFGIDPSGGGDIAGAAARAGADPEALLDALHAALAGGEGR